VPILALPARTARKSAAVSTGLSRLALLVRLSGVPESGRSGATLPPARSARINISFTEEFQIVPEQSTSAIIVHHPEAKYFNIKEVASQNDGDGGE